MIIQVLMYVLFDVLKGVFFFLTLMMALFFLRGEVVIGAGYYSVVKQIMMPGYLLFCGVMFGYIVAHLWVGVRDEDVRKHQIFVQSFMIGLAVGLFLALSYMLL